MNKYPTGILFFYQGDKLLTVKEGAKSSTVLRSADLPLAELHGDIETAATLLLATDNKGSPVHATHEKHDTPYRYTAYGHDPVPCPPTWILLGFNGAPRAPAQGGYLLGNGYRAYCPATMRFNAPDSLSPFGNGGVNSYAYCAGEPVNHSDPSGHMRVYLRNGQIMQTHKNGTFAAGSWINPAPKDPSYRKSLVNKTLQRPRTVAADNPVAEGRTHVRVVELFRHPKSSLDTVHLQLMDMTDFQRNRAEISVLAKLMQEPHAPFLDYASKLSQVFDKNESLIARGEHYWVKSDKVNRAVSKIRGTGPD